MQKLDNADRVREYDEKGHYLPIPEGERHLTQQQLLAIEYIASGVTKTATARKLGVTSVTITNWGKIPEYQTELMAACQRRLIEAVPDSLDLLHKQVTNKKLNPFARQNAARDLLDRAGVGRNNEQQATQIIVEVTQGMPELGQAQETIVNVEADVQ